MEFHKFPMLCERYGRGGKLCLLLEHKDLPGQRAWVFIAGWNIAGWNNDPLSKDVGKGHFCWLLKGPFSKDVLVPLVRPSQTCWVRQELDSLAGFEAGRRKSQPPEFRCAKWDWTRVQACCKHPSHGLLDYRWIGLKLLGSSDRQSQSHHQRQRLPPVNPLQLRPEQRAAPLLAWLQQAWSCGRSIG